MQEVPLHVLCTSGASQMAAHNLERRKVKIVLIIIQEIHFHSSNNEMSKAKLVWECGLNGGDKECTQKPLPKTPTSKNEMSFLYLIYLKGKQNSLTHIISILL